MKIILVLIAMIGFQSSVYSQTEYSKQTLAVKRWFTNNELSALAEKFVGISSKSGIQNGLFPIKSTSISTQSIIDSGTDFLKALSPIQKLRTQFSVDDPEWRKWSNVEYHHNGQS